MPTPLRMKERLSGNRRRATPPPKFHREPVATLGKPDPTSVLVARTLLDNIARRLDVGRASAVVCRLALSVRNTEHDRNVAIVLKGLIAEELERQIERLDQITHAQPKTIRAAHGRRRDAAVDKPAEVLAVHVSRSTLSDIRYRLNLAVGTTAVCHTALVAQNVKAKDVQSNIDVAATLDHVVIALLGRQIERIYAITNARPKKGRVVVGVAP